MSEATCNVFKLTDYNIFLIQRVEGEKKSDFGQNTRGYKIVW